MYINNVALTAGTTVFFVSSGTVDGKFTIDSIPSVAVGHVFSNMTTLLNNSSFVNLHQQTLTGFGNNQPVEFDFKNQGADGSQYILWTMGNPSLGTSLQIGDHRGTYMMQGFGDGRGETVILSTSTGVLNLPHKATLGIYGINYSNPFLDAGYSDGSGNLTSVFTVNKSSVQFNVPTITVGTTISSYSLQTGTSSIPSSFQMAVSTTGHILSLGLVPTISSCGSAPNPSVTGTDNVGTIVAGGGAVTSCTLTFATPWGAAPTCVMSDNSTALTGDISSLTNTAITFSFSLSIGGGNIYYMCMGSK